MHAHFSSEHVEEFKTTASERNGYEIFSTRNHSYMVIVFCLLMGAMLDGVEMLATTACLRVSVNTVNAVFILHRVRDWLLAGKERSHRWSQLMLLQPARSKRLVARWKRKKRLLSDFNKVKEDLNNAIDGLKERVLSDIDKVKEDLNNAIDGVREMVLSDDDAAVGVTRSKILLQKPKLVDMMESAKARLCEIAPRYDPNIAKKTALSDDVKGKEDLNYAVDGVREMVLSDDKKDEEDVFNGAVDKLCKTTEAWAERMREEWRILEESLPETIFVRAYESRMDLLRAAIIGAKGTPYQDGLFFFDVYFPPAYPVQPPLVRYHSGGLAINPHLFECREVRLNLFRSYNYKSWTLWPSSDTNMLDFLVSIQEQVLNAHPLFHQPGFVDSSPSVVAEYFSLLYNEAIQLKSFETMTFVIKNPPKNFEVFVLGYFRDRAVDILRATNAYREGLQVPDGVDNRESFKIRDDVDSSMICLFVAFVQIRATGVLNFTPIGPFVGFGSFLERSIESASTSPVPI